MASKSARELLKVEINRFKNTPTSIPQFSTIDDSRAQFILGTIGNLPDAAIDILSDRLIYDLTDKFEKVNNLATLILGRHVTQAQIGEYKSKLEELYDYVVRVSPEINMNLGALTQTLIADLELQRAKAEAEYTTSLDRIQHEKNRAEQEKLRFEKERSELLKQLQASIGESQEGAARIDELKVLLEKQSREFDARLEPILKKAEVFAQGITFLETANRNTKVSYLWIGLIVAMITTLLIFINRISHLCLDFSCFNENNTLIKATIAERQNLFIYYIIKKILSNLLIISLLIYLLKFAVTNYNAVMHNQTINSHKANAFAASLNLIGSVKDATKQDEILNLAAKEIFTQQKTGYLTKEGNDINISMLEKIAALFK
jgi:hypothetical protein